MKDTAVHFVVSLQPNVEHIGSLGRPHHAPVGHLAGSARSACAVCSVPGIRGILGGLWPVRTSPVYIQHRRHLHLALGVPGVPAPA
jgi:hypothetical protein